MRRVFLDKCQEAKRRENPGKSGLKPTAPIPRSEDIALYQLSQILNYKTDGSLVNFRRMPFQSRKPQRMLIMDIRRNADRLTLIYTATLSRFGSGPCMQAYGGASRHYRTRTRSCQTRTPSTFSFWSEKKGVRPHPPNPPWLRA